MWPLRNISSLMLSCISGPPRDQHVPDVSNGARGVQPLRAEGHAVHDAAAAEYAEGIFQARQTLLRLVVPAVREEAIRRQEARRADELVRVPPEGGAARRTAGAENALIESVELGAILR